MLLAITLGELWPYREGHRLTYAGYQAVEGVHGVLGRIAERTYQSLNQAQQAVARKALVRRGPRQTNPHS